MYIKRKLNFYYRLHDIMAKICLQRWCIVTKKLKAYFSGPDRVHKTLMLLMQLISILIMYLWVVVGMINNSRSNFGGFQLFLIIMCIFFIIYPIHLSRCISQDTLEVIFMDIWLCFVFFITLIMSLDVYVSFIKLSTFVTENEMLIKVVGSSLLFLLYKFVKSRKIMKFRSK